MRVSARRQEVHEETAEQSAASSEALDSLAATTASTAISARAAAAGLAGPSLGGEARVLAGHVLGRAARTGRRLVRVHELLEMALAFHADVFVDWHLSQCSWSFRSQASSTDRVQARTGADETADASRALLFSPATEPPARGVVPRYRPAKARSTRFRAKTASIRTLDRNRTRDRWRRDPPSRCARRLH
jgi:hypothetical protein